MDLGNLGRILARPLPDRHWQIECEIAGDTDDPMMEKRKAVFGPLSQALNTELERQMGGKAGNVDILPTRLPSAGESHLVPSKFLQCDRCDGFYAHLIFADHARTRGDMEDMARLTFSMVREANFPTWIIGAATEASIVPTKARSMVLKVWPEREDICWLTLDEFDVQIEALKRAHCGS